MVNQHKKEPAIEDSAVPAPPIWHAFAVLLAITLASQLASVTYTSDQSFSAILLPSLFALLIVTTPLAASGLWLGAKIGLGAPILLAMLTRSPGAGQRFLLDSLRAGGLGLAIGLFLWFLRIVLIEYLPPELPPLGHRGVVGGLLVSISAAIAEEVWLRLGVMTILAWILVRASGLRVLTPGIAWTAIILSALAFGAIHLPQLAAASAATPIGITATVMGNSLVGITCGWLFWKHGILAAMVAHFATDLVLHVVPALVG